MLGSLAVAAGCAASAHESSAGGSGDGYGAAFEGDGVQCGAIICSGAQVCCIVPTPSEASSMGPAGKCDENCESVCADSCPDAGNTSMPAGGGPGGAPSTTQSGGSMTTGAPTEAGAPASPMAPDDAMAGPVGPRM